MCCSHPEGLTDSQLSAIEKRATKNRKGEDSGDEAQDSPHVTWNLLCGFGLKYLCKPTPVLDLHCGVIYCQLVSVGGNVCIPYMPVIHASMTI